jgi:hypothetical protein
MPARPTQPTTTAAATPDSAASLRAQHVFEQVKLTRDEWVGLEVPLPPDEIAILKMMTQGWQDPDVCTNPRRSILDATKLGSLSAPHEFVYSQFLAKRVAVVAKALGIPPPEPVQEGKGRKNKTKLTSADEIRLGNIDLKSLAARNDIWDLALLGFLEDMTSRPTPVRYYTLARALEARVDGTNTHLLEFATRALQQLRTRVSVRDMVADIEPASELNPLLQTFANRVLYKHQRDLIAALKREGPKLVLYQAPTGTGKTLSPLAIEEYKVIFVCASKHVGMQLARAAISIQKRIAVAFGCRDGGDIRLHYYAVSECTRRRRTGAIGKVDHTQGQKVDLIITDATSYLPAMHYMRTFNDINKLLVYWDEPTIAMDKPADELHDIIRRSWKENAVPNMVLSSATLPPPSHLPRFVDAMQSKFRIPDDNIITISNYECARTVPVLLKSGHVAMPHNTAETMGELKMMVEQCSSRATLLRHIDLGVAARCLLEASAICPCLEQFERIEDVTPEAVKRAYLRWLVPVAEEIGIARVRALADEGRRYTGGVNLGAGDAASITYGPVLYLATDTEKVARYIIGNANPPASIIESLVEQVDLNAETMQQIERLEKDLADRRDGGVGGDDSDDEFEHGGGIAQKLATMRQKLGELRLPDREVPNTAEHQRRYHHTVDEEAFQGSVPAHHLEKVLRLDVANWKKMLLMMGIGVFGESCPTYRELMSRMASQRELFCVIAGSDYVYGTNYQFCHGYIGKDLSQIPVEKLYQALGRVGRGRQAGQYSWRLRDDSLAKRVFCPDTRLTEARRMDKLMSGC